MPYPSYSAAQGPTGLDCPDGFSDIELSRGPWKSIPQEVRLRVLVTGGAGFIGSHIVDRLVENGHEVVVADDLSSGRRTNVNPEARLVEIDISDPGFPEFAASLRPDAISHWAAQASVPASVSDPGRDAMVNVVGGINVCRAAVMAGCSQLVYANTGGALYGEPEYLPCDEDHPKRPISPYGLSKCTVEQYLPVLLPASMGVKVLRPANVYGPRQDPHGESGVVAIFASRMARGEPVTIFGDGGHTRDYVYVDDVVDAHELALESGNSLTVNIGSGAETSVHELFRAMSAVSGYDLPPQPADERPGDVRRICLDSTRAHDLLGWRPSTSLAEGLRKTWEAFSASTLPGGTP